MLVFSQKAEFDPRALARQAARHFDCQLDFAGAPGDDGWQSVRLHGHGRFEGCFRLRSRLVEASDQTGLDDAQAANGSYGMADLARRCRHVWEFSVEAGTEPASSYYLAAILASVALGPLLPPDAGGLYGVRSCRERAEALRKPSG